MWVLICMVHLTVCSYHVIYTFGSESTLYSCLNAKELLARNRCEIWNLSDSNFKWLSVCLWTKWFGFKSSCSHLDSVLLFFFWLFHINFSIHMFVFLVYLGFFCLLEKFTVTSWELFWIAEFVFNVLSFTVGLSWLGRISQ